MSAALDKLGPAILKKAKGLIVTTDWSFSHGRDWGSPKIPEKMDLKTIIKMSPEVITKPRYMWTWGKTLRPPELSVPNQAINGQAPPVDASDRFARATIPPSTVRSRSPRPSTPRKIMSPNRPWATAPFPSLNRSGRMPL